MADGTEGAAAEPQAEHEAHDVELAQEAGADPAAIDDAADQQDQNAGEDLAKEAESIEQRLDQVVHHEQEGTTAD
jgi:hypothetical protein